MAGTSKAALQMPPQLLKQPPVIRISHMTPLRELHPARILNRKLPPRQRRRRRLSPRHEGDPRTAHLILQALGIDAGPRAMRRFLFHIAESIGNAGAVLGSHASLIGYDKAHLVVVAGRIGILFSRS